MSVTKDSIAFIEATSNIHVPVHTSLSPSVTKFSILRERSLTSLILVCKLNYHRDKIPESRREDCTADLNYNRL